MTGFVVPFETRQTNSQVWTAWWAKADRPPLFVRIYAPDNTILHEIPLDGNWKPIGLEGEKPNEAVCQYRLVNITGLQPATSYRVALCRSPSGRVESVGFVETLPDRLPQDGQRPFTILLGSCYYAPADPNREASLAYRRLWNSTATRPHLKILTGDQVYLDQPAGPAEPDMRDRKSSVELRRWIIAKYRESWLNLQEMLQRGANYMTSDDHEFWNDYPERPLIWAWRALHQSLQYRRDWGAEARAHFREIQNGISVSQIDIGGDLSIFIADTRVNRQRDGVHFMSDDDFNTMLNWIRNLKTPGVLVLGQPVLASPKNLWGTTTTDRNLPHFTQYDDLANALLRWCKHDLLILAGDVHFGRIAKFDLRVHYDYPVSVHEVVSSGMTVLPSAKNRFRFGQGGVGDPFGFPPYRAGEKYLLGSPVAYKQVVPTMMTDDDGTENHFMTLEFTRHPTGRGVAVRIRPWLVNREPVDGLPSSPWTYSCSLDVGHPFTREVFGRTGIGDVIHYSWWFDEGWRAANVTRLPRIGEPFTIQSDPIVVNLVNIRGPVLQHVFGRRGDGDLIHYWWWDQDGWRAENLTERPHIGPSYRISGDPVVVNLRNDTTILQHVFARNAASELIHYWWWAKEGWKAENLTTYTNIGSAYDIAFDPVVINLRQGNMISQHAFAANRLNELIHYWWTAQQGWKAENLTKFRGRSELYRISGAPAVIDLPLGNTPTLHVLARSTQGDLIHYWWSAQQGWVVQNVTQQYSNIGSSYRIFGMPAVLRFKSGNTFMLHVFGRNGQGDLIHYWWSLPELWKAENLTKYPNIGNTYRILGDPVVTNLKHGNIFLQHVFGNSANYELIHYWWSGQEGWKAENLTKYPNIGDTYAIATPPTLLWRGSGDTITQHAFARNSNIELVHYWWSAREGWKAENLTQNLGAAYGIAGRPSVVRP